MSLGRIIGRLLGWYSKCCDAVVEYRRGWHTDGRDDGNFCTACGERV